MFNKVVLVGNLTRNIELRYSSNGGLAVGNTAIAVTRKFTVNGEKREETCFIDLTFFGRTAEIANQYLSKGSKILVEGKLKLDQWTDNNGQNRSKHSVIVENMEMLGGGVNQNTNTQNNQYSQQPYNNEYSNKNYNTNNTKSTYNNEYNSGYQKSNNTKREDYIDENIDVDQEDDIIPF